MSPRIPALLCDLDGTLIDSTRSLGAAFEWWAGERGLTGDVFSRVPRGRTSADAVAQLAPELDATAEGALLDRRQAEFTDGVSPLPGAHRLLTQAERVAIVTSCSAPLARARLRAAALPEPPVLITHELLQRGKPDPEGYLLAAARLDADPYECVVLEDAPAGVRAGVAAGMRVIAILTTHAPEELGGASEIVGTLEEAWEVALKLSPA